MPSVAPDCTSIVSPGSVAFLINHRDFLEGHGFAPLVETNAASLENWTEKDRIRAANRELAFAYHKNQLVASEH